MACVLGWCGASLLWAQPPAPAEPVSAGAPPASQTPEVPAPRTGGKQPAAPVSVSSDPASETARAATQPSAAAQPGTPSAAQSQAPQETKVVDFTAELMRPVKVGDSSALSLVGRVVFHHNGAVITCDSAIRYNDRQMDCFRNVIINQDSVFIYGDRAEYNGFINTARVYAPLVKVVDKDAVFYTYNFSFNTLDNIGHYTGGGTMLQGENRLESQEGFYYVDPRVLIGVENVEMENPDYRMRSDSVSYDMNTEVASFFTRSYIWNSKDEFLTAVRGDYDRKQEKYTFTDSSYILTATQEVWADTLIYTQQNGDALLLRNVQVVDEEQKAMAFGDYIRYWGQQRKAVLTRDPVVASYEEQGEQTDTLFMRADSMFIFTVNRFDTLANDSIPADSLAADSIQRAALSGLPGLMEHDPLNPASEQTAIEQAGQEAAAADAVAEETELTGEAEADIAQEKETRPMTAKQLRAAEKQKKKEEARQAREQARRLKREKQRAALMQLRGEAARADSLAKADSLSRAAALADSLAQVQSADTLAAEQPADSVLLSQDSLQRQMFAYHNVRVFRNDFQAVCDSMTGFTIDSTLHMYIRPVLWNENNQITSTTVDIYTRNQMIQKAVFIGDPIMSSEVDGLHYNQIKGKVIETYFRDGAIFRTDVNGNGQTYYYLEEEDSLGRYISGFMTVECADISFYFQDKQIDEIVWRGNPVYSIYPMEKIPGEVSQLLPGFSWESARRPELKDVFDRTMRPSQRDYYRSIDKPLYPITRKIDQYREQLIKEGSWRDRNDPLSSEAVEFLQSLQSVAL